MLLQAAESLAEVAFQHASDPAFQSPYTIEALKQGFDIPLWEKLWTSSFQNGSFVIGKLTVC